MAESQTHVASQSSTTIRDIASIKKEYDDICARLNVDGDSQKFAWILLERFYTSAHPEQSLIQSENVKQWFVCALYIIATKTLPEFSSTATFVSLSQLLRETGIRLVDFFEPLKQFIVALNLHPCLIKLEHLEKKYIVMKLLFEKYERLYETLFKRDKSQLTKKRQKEPESEKIFAFGWKLFLVTRGKLLKDPPDLVESIHLLICCVDLLFVHMPQNERRVSVRDALESLKTNKEEHISEISPFGSVTTLQYLSTLNHAIFEQVFHLYDHIFIPYVKTLCDNEILKYQPAKIPPDPLLTKSFYLGGLLDTHLDVNLRAVNQEYEMMCYDSCDFDERLFLQYHPQLQTPTRPMVPQTPPLIGSGIKARSRLTDDLRNKIPPTPSVLQTPARQTLVAVSWLQRTLSNQSDQPNEVLLRLFKQCTPDPTQSIVARVAQFLSLVNFPNDQSQRQTLTIKLYYRLLEAILVTEEARLKKEKGIAEVNFSGLLNNEKFHKSLLACCLEIVIASHKIVEMTFPYSLQLLQLQPFDFCKVIEAVVKHEPTLPSAVIKHLVSIEERILESMAWEGDSPLFTALTVEQRQTFLARLQETGSPQRPSQNACLLFASPMKTKNTPSLISTQRHSNPSVELFFRKVAYLASLRIIKLCADLQEDSEGKIRISDRIERQIEYAFVYILIEHSELMQNRHIDQLIMCVLYAICKVNKIDITFRTIINKYQKQPQANSEVYKNVRLNEKETGDIIRFYNTVFIPRLEQFLLQFQDQSTSDYEQESSLVSNNSSVGKSVNNPNNETNNPMTPSYLQVLSPFVFKQKSPQKLQNLMISPRRTPLLMEDRSANNSTNKYTNSISYQFGISPAKDLEQINRSINRESVRRQLNFDKVSTEETIKENERNLKRKHEEAELVASVFEGMQNQTAAKIEESDKLSKKQRK